MSNETRILQVNFGKRHAEYKARLQAIGESLEVQGIDVSDSKRGGISLAAVIRHMIDTQAENRLNVRLWEVVHNKLQRLIEAGNGKVSKADIINWSIMNFDEADVKAQVALETISDNAYAEQFVDEDE